jgi:glycosyltransferase involved in cell wall biosynthesis
LVLPSDYGETWGLVVNEAMACGLPAIVSDRVGCGPDLVSAAGAGFIFPFGDHALLSAAMRRMASEPSQAQQMGERAKKRLARYSIESAVAGVLDWASTTLIRAPEPLTTRGAV